MTADEHSAAQDDDSRELALAMGRVCAEKKAENVQILDVSAMIGHLTDYFVIASGRNRRQVQAIADELQLVGKELGKKTLGPIEGYREGSWVLLDYVDVIVHVFLAETREHYDLELNWGDAPRLTLDGAVAEGDQATGEAAAEAGQQPAAEGVEPA